MHSKRSGKPTIWLCRGTTKIDYRESIVRVGDNDVERGGRRRSTQAVPKRQLRNESGCGPPKILCPNIVKVKYAGIPVKASNGRHFSDGIDGRRHVDVDEFAELDDNDIAAPFPAN